MGNLWLKIKIWTKVTVASLIGLYILIFVFKNSGQPVKFWYWYKREYQGSLLSLVAFAFLIGGLVAILATTTVRTIRQVKELRARTRSQRLEAEVEDMKTKAAMLQTKPVGDVGAVGGASTFSPPPPPPNP